ncbi:MAG: hypothetical protein ABWY93_05770 [Mycobacterium sp.]
MTSPSQQTETNDQVSTPPDHQIDEFDVAPVQHDREEDYPVAPAEPAEPAGDVNTAGDLNPPAVDTPPAAAPVDTESPDTLFAESDLSDLRARWTEVQAAFVDDPKDCVQKADGLVSDAVDQLTAGFSHARSRLEEQWARGEEASTEDLRLALKRYREFFERLLAV